MDRGKRIHERIEGMFPSFRVEYSGVFDDPSLPFLIAYHPDLWCVEAGIVIDVKPFVWGFMREEVHVDQISGYAYFLKAGKAFFLYYFWDVFPEGNPVLCLREVEVRSWRVLRVKALEGYEGSPSFVFLRLLPPSYPFFPFYLTISVPMP